MLLKGENIRTQRKTCSSVTLSTKNVTGLGSNLGLCNEWSANNSLSHGTAGKI